MSETRFRKIAFDGDTVTICQQEKSDKTVTEKKTECSEQPSQAFRDALQALREHVITICECPPEWEKDLTIRSVSMSYTDADVMTVVITALRALKWSAAPMIINTPAKPETPYAEGGDDTNCLSKEACFAIDHLGIYALAYLEGDRWAVQDELPDIPLEKVPRVTFTSPDGEVLLDMSGAEFARAAVKAGRR